MMSSRRFLWLPIFIALVVAMGFGWVDASGVSIVRWREVER